MKTASIFLASILLISASSCRRDTIIYRTKPTVIKNSGYRAPSTPKPAPKLAPGNPITLGDPTPAGTATSY